MMNGFYDMIVADTVLTALWLYAICIGEDDMFDVIEALSPVAAKWKAIGTALRIKRNKLDELESTHKGDVQDCLADTVAEYLRLGYNTKKYGEPTWLNIIKAVEHSAGGNNRAHAISIAKDHLILCEIQYMQ